MGGNIFENTSTIEQDNIDNTIKQYLNEIKSVFPSIELNPTLIGSAGKVPVSGDIDLAFDISNFSNPLDFGIVEDDYNKTLDILTKRARTSTLEQLKTKALLIHISKRLNEYSTIIANEKKVGIGSLFTSYSQYDKFNIKTRFTVQIDWSVGNLDWLCFSYYSDSYLGNIKGLHRTQLLVSLFDKLNCTFSHVYGIKNRKTKEIIADTPLKAIKILNDNFNLKLNQHHLNNYYNLHYHIKKFLSEEDYNSVIDYYLKILDSTRCDIPDDMQFQWLDKKIDLGLTGKFIPSTSNLNSICQE